MQRLSQDGVVRIGGAGAIPEVLESLGVKPADVLAEAGLDPNLFDDPDNLVSYSARSRLLAICVARTGCRHFGLLVGQQGGLSSLGLVGYLVMHSPDVQSALQSLVHYFHLHAQGAAVYLMKDNGLAFLGYSIYQPDVEASEQIEDGAVAIAFNILRKLCGPEWVPAEVCFAHRKPRGLRPFRRFFKASMRFDAEQNGVFFPAQWLEQPVPEADPELHRLLQQQINRLEAEYQEDFPEQIRRVLSIALLTNHATADQVAALFSMHTRTLHRRLRAFDTSFKELADQSRYRIARQMLEDSEIDLIQIAGMLHYADSRSFTRAFKRWSGATPARWRAERKRGKVADALF